MLRPALVEPGVVRTGFFDAATRVPPSAPYRGGPADRPPQRDNAATADFA
jgi:hypothetical protein